MRSYRIETGNEELYRIETGNEELQNRDWE